MPHMQEIRRKQ